MVARLITRSKHNFRMPQRSEVFLFRGRSVETNAHLGIRRIGVGRSRGTGVRELALGRFMYLLTKVPCFGRFCSSVRLVAPSVVSSLQLLPTTYTRFLFCFLFAGPREPVYTLFGDFAACSFGLCGRGFGVVGFFRREEQGRALGKEGGFNKTEVRHIRGAHVGQGRRIGVFIGRDITASSFSRSFSCFFSPSPLGFSDKMRSPFLLLLLAAAVHASHPYRRRQLPGPPNDAVVPVYPAAAVPAAVAPPPNDAVVYNGDPAVTTPASTPTVVPGTTVSAGTFRVAATEHTHPTRVPSKVRTSETVATGHTSVGDGDGGATSYKSGVTTSVATHVASARPRISYSPSVGFARGNSSFSLHRWHSIANATVRTWRHTAVSTGTIKTWHTAVFTGARAGNATVTTMGSTPTRTAVAAGGGGKGGGGDSGEAPCFSADCKNPDSGMRYTQDLPMGPQQGQEGAAAAAIGKWGAWGWGLVALGVGVGVVGL